jgi:hypothetical protein
MYCHVKIGSSVLFVVGSHTTIINYNKLVIVKDPLLRLQTAMRDSTTNTMNVPMVT